MASLSFTKSFPLYFGSYGTHVIPSFQRLRRVIPHAKPSKSGTLPDPDPPQPFLEFKKEVENSPGDLKITSSLSRGVSLSDL